jgi:hypothetical protein
VETEIENALLRYAARSIGLQDVLRALESATTREALAEMMKGIAATRKTLFENRLLWPPDKRDAMWQQVVDKNKEKWATLPGKAGVYEFGEEDRKNMRQGIEAMIFRGEREEAVSNLDLYDQKFPDDSWSRLQRAKVVLN